MTNRFIQLGSGPWGLPEPWENYDQDMDITRPLPIPDQSVRFLLCEHTIEHVTFIQGWNFLLECHRVIEVNGVLRLSFPDVTRITQGNFEAYAKFLERKHGQKHHLDDVYRSMLTGWGHQACWTKDMALRVMHAVGFTPSVCEYGVSEHPELHDIDHHHQSVGVNTAILETTVIEGYRNPNRGIVR